MISAPRRKPGVAVPWLPIWVQTFCCRAVSRISRASQTECASGFWQ